MGGAVVSRKKERVRWFYEVGCPKVKLEQEGEGFVERLRRGLLKGQRENKFERGAVVARDMCQCSLQMCECSLHVLYVRM